MNVLVTRIAALCLQQPRDEAINDDDWSYYVTFRVKCVVRKIWIGIQICIRICIRIRSWIWIWSKPMPKPSNYLLSYRYWSHVSRSVGRACDGRLRRYTGELAGRQVSRYETRHQFAFAYFRCRCLSHSLAVVSLRR